MMNASRLALLGAIVVAFLVASSGHARSRLQGELEPGPHSVGFRILDGHDFSRPALADTTSVPGHPRAGRPMPVAVWYPARPSASAVMRFGDYVELRARESALVTSGEAQRSRANIAPAVDFPDVAPDLVPAVLGLETTARHEAPAAAGRFPVIVWASASPIEISVAAEHLASHGFVVAATPLKGAYDPEVDVTTAGIETVVADMQFVTNRVASLPVADVHRLGVAGFSFGAMACLGFHLRNPGVGAIASLDGGIATPFGDGALRRSPYFDPASITAPLLHTWSPHPTVHDTLLRAYKHSSRWVVRFPTMRHADFANIGWVTHAVSPAPDSGLSRAYPALAWHARYLRHFFQAHLLSDRESRAFLDRDHGVPEGLVRVERLSALPAPPSLPMLKAMVRNGGAPPVVDAFRRMRERDPQPFSAERFVDLQTWVEALWGRDGDGRVRYELARLRAESYPTSARALFALGHAAQRIGDRETARRSFAQAARLLAEDPDPLLTLVRRRAIESAARDVAHP
jgi:hypothetical protein